MSARSMTDMTLERLRQIVGAYGADPCRWPEAERKQAEAFVARVAEAQDLLAQARELDSMLSVVPAHVPDAAMARLTAATAFPPSRPNKSAAMGSSGGSSSGWLANLASAFWPRATVCASMAAFGIIVGLAIEPIYSGGDANTTVIGDFNVDVAEDLGL